VNGKKEAEAHPVILTQVNRHFVPYIEMRSKGDKIECIGR